MAENRLLSVKVNEEMYAEFSAACLVLRYRTMSAAVHQFAVQKIREAQAAVGEEQFRTVVEQVREDIEKRSRSLRRGRQGVPVPSNSHQTVKAVPSKKKRRKAG